MRAILWGRRLAPSGGRAGGALQAHDFDAAGASGDGDDDGGVWSVERGEVADGLGDSQHDLRGCIGFRDGVPALEQALAARGETDCGGENHLLGSGRRSNLGGETEGALRDIGRDFEKIISGGAPVLLQEVGKPESVTVADVFRE